MAFGGNNIQIVVEAVTAQAERGLVAVQSKLSDFGKSALDAEKKVDSLNEKFEKLGKIGQVLAVAGGTVSVSLGLLGRSAIKAAGEYEQTKMAFESMLGSAEQAVVLLSDLKKLAAETPFEFTDVTEYSKRLLAMGISVDSLVDNISMLGDISSGVGRDKLPQLTLAFGQVRSAGRLTGMELRQFTEAGVPLIEELAKSFGKTTSEITKMVGEGTVKFKDVEDALRNMTSEGGKFYKMQETQAKTLLGTISKLKDEIGFLSIAFGDELIPAAKPIIDFFSKIVEKLNGLSITNKQVIATIGFIVFGIASLVTTVGTFLAFLPFVISGMTLLGVTIAGVASATGIGALIVAFGALSFLASRHTAEIKKAFLVMKSVILDSVASILESLDSLVDKYNSVANRVRGLPVIDFGLKKAASTVRFNANAIKEEIAALDKIINKKNRKVEPLISGGAVLAAGSSTGSVGETQLTPSTQQKTQEIIDEKVSEKDALSEALAAVDLSISEAKSLADLDAAKTQLLLMDRASLEKVGLLKKYAELEKKIDRSITENKLKEEETRRQNFSNTMSYLESGARSNNATIAAIGKAAAIFNATIQAYNAFNVALASAPPPFNFALAAGSLAVGLNNVQQIASTPLPSFADGGATTAKDGGRIVRVAEAGDDEAMIPLDNPDVARRIQAAAGGGGGQTTIVLQLDGITFGQAVVDSYNRGRSINAVTRITQS